MPYFSFILNEKKVIPIIEEYGEFDKGIKYYSKNTKLWSKLSKLKKLNLIDLNYEIRHPCKKIYNSILFCLPPNIGLGDAIEYGLAIKSIKNHYPKKIIGVAYVGHFKNIFYNHFGIESVYDYISEERLFFYDSLFHFTSEISDLVFQKYDRKNIEKIITDYFKIPLYRKKETVGNKKIKINTISIFPISQSPLRSLPISILNAIVNNFVSNYKIEIFLDSKSEISNYIKNNLKFKNKLNFYDPRNLNILMQHVKDIQFGVFPDSGPLHLAKILNKKGVLITSSVHHDILLNQFSSIKGIESSYKSKYCNGPCGLVNSFEYDGNSGCYDSLSVFKDDIMTMQNKKNLQRGNLKKNYLKLYMNSVNCFKYYNNTIINKNIEKHLDNNKI